ncbi:MAG: D-mannonate epimerase [Kiritimatiellae bacterium]|nr:D-mannonate epimerase [Kiritimatiellia bacterium]
MLYFARGSVSDQLTPADLEAGIAEACARLGARRRVLLVPPDITRFHSRAGDMACAAWRHYGDRVKGVLPALGTHSPMTPPQIERMYPGMPQALFKVHDWREGVRTLGRVPADFVREVSEGAVDYDWPAQVDHLLLDGDFDLIFSLGQVVPHEVVGMANHNKNIFVGTGGPEGINKSHYLGAAYGMERIMGRAITPVRRVFDYASEHFAGQLPIVYALTVLSGDGNGGLALRGLYIGDDAECFRLAAELSLKVNFHLLERPLRKVVVYLDPHEYKSTWLGNKSIYRTRMAIADGGELIVLAPGVKEFGEDAEIDRLIRRYGYKGTPATQAAVRAQPELAANLSAAAHLIHGSSEGRFSITYCPGHLSRAEIEGAGFQYGELAAMRRRYDIAKLRDGPNSLPGGEEIFYISNPALGLWASRNRFF